MFAQGVGNLKKMLSGESPDIIGLLGYYRYISWAAASFFYLAGGTAASHPYLKLGVVLCLFLAALTFTGIFQREVNAARRMLLLFIETVGLALVLTLTGNITGPFLWYAITPILLSAAVGPVYFCWLLFAVFYAMAALLQKFTGAGLSIWADGAVIFPVLCFMTLIVQISSYFTDKISWQSRNMREQMHHIKSLYEAVEAFSHYLEPREILSLFASYGRALTGAVKVIIWVEAGLDAGRPQLQSFYAVRGPRAVLTEEIWLPYLQRVLEERKTGPGMAAQHFPMAAGLSSGTLITLRIKTGATALGVLSAFYPGRRDMKGEPLETLKFLADLCALTLEKQFLEHTAARFMLMEEQERIAGGIYDRVTQNLFGIVYTLDTLIKKKTLEKSLREHLVILQQSARESIRELRASTYETGLADGESGIFVSVLKQYLENLTQLNDIKLDFKCEGDFKGITPATRRFLYRILREAVGNAVRHSGCGVIYLSLTLTEAKIKLTVADDGRGFTVPALERGARSGLGLVSMRELVRGRGGKFAIESAADKGTKIYCEISLTPDEYYPETGS